MSSTGSVPVGREAELSALLDMLVSPTKDRAVVVEGEAGIGKTTLVDAALARLPRRHVFRAGAEEMESLRPFGVVADAFGVPGGIGDVRQELAAVFAGLAPAGAEPRTVAFRIFELLLTVVEEETLGEPSVVVLEDLHWADPASLAVLHRLARALPQRGCAVVCTTRRLPRRPELAQLLEGIDAAGGVRIGLGPLSLPDTRELVTALIGARPGPGLLKQAAKAGGNPLYLTELVRALVDEGSIWARSDGLAESSAAARAPSLRVTILRRLSSLTSEATEVLSMAAVLGMHFSVRDLSIVSGRSAVELGSVVRSGLRAGLLHESGDRLGFRHELVRDALYDDIPTSMRSALHRDIARALGSAGAAPLRVAEHLILGAGPGDADAVSWLRRAAADAAPRAPAVAAQLARQALTLADEADPARGELAADLAIALVRSGRIGEGEAACRDVLDRGAPAGREGALRFCLAQTVLAQGDLQAAGMLVEEAMAAGGLTAAEKARLLAWASLLPTFGGDFSAAVSAADRAEEMAVAAGDVPAHVRALLTRAHLAINASRLADAERLAARAVALAEADGTREAVDGVPHLVHALVLVDTDRVDEAADLVRRGRRVAETFGDQYGLLFAHLVDSYRLFVTGEWDDALAEVEAASSLADEVGTQGNRVAGLCAAAVMMLWRGGVDPAATWLEQAEQAPPGYEYRAVWVAWAKARCAQAAGRPQAALDLLAGAWQSCVAAGLALEYRLLGPDVAALAASGEPDLAAQVAAELQTVSAANPHVASLRGAASRAMGLAEDDPDLLLLALAAYRDSPRRPERAGTAMQAAAALLRSGRREEARCVAAEALQLCADIGATWQADRIRAELRQMGLRLGARDARRAARSGWDALTPTETRVVALVGQRLSNPQIGERLFISRRTVESHVSHALAKLGLSSRGQLVDALAARAVEDRGEYPEQR